MRARARVRGLLDRPPGWRPGDLLPGRGCGRCYGCHWPWWAVAHFSVWLDDTTAMFALCSSCWRRSSTPARLAAYLWLLDQQARTAAEAAGDDPVTGVVDPQDEYARRRARLVAAIEAGRPELYRAGPSWPGGAAWPGGAS